MVEVSLYFFWPFYLVLVFLLDRLLITHLAKHLYENLGDYHVCFVTVLHLSDPCPRLSSLLAYSPLKVGIYMPFILLGQRSPSIPLDVAVVFLQYLWELIIGSTACLMYTVADSKLAWLLLIILLLYRLCWSTYNKISISNVYK